MANFTLPSQAGGSPTQTKLAGYVSPFAKTDLATEWRAQEKHQTQSNIATKLKTIHTLKSKDQDDLLKKAKAAGVLDNRQASAIRSQLLATTNIPKTQLNPLEKTVNFGVSAARAPFRAAASVAASVPTKTSSKPAEVLKTLQGMDVNTRKATIAKSEGYKTILKNAGFDINNPTDDAITKFIGKSNTAVKKQQTITPKGPASVLLGDEKIQGAQLRLEGTKEALKAKGLTEKEAGIVAPLGVGAALGLDLAPAASGAVVKSIVKKGVTTTAEKALGKEGAAQLATKVSPIIHPIDTATKALVEKGGKAVGAVLGKIPGSGTVAAKVTQGKDFAMTKMVEELHPLFKAIGQAEKGGKVAAGTKNELDLLRGNAAGAGRQTKDFVEHNEKFQGLFNSIAELHPNTKVAQKDFDQYATATREMQLMKQGKKVANPDRYAKFKMQADTLRAKYGDKIEAARTNLVDANKEVTKILKGSGLSEKDFEHYMKEDPEYLRTQRVVDDHRKKQPFARGGSAGDIAHQKVNKFAESEALPATSTLLDRAYHAHAFVHANKLKEKSVEALGKAGLTAKPLRTTEKVLTRNEIRQSLKDSKPLKQQLEKLVSSHKSTITKLNKEIASLHRQGKEKFEAKAGEIKDYVIKKGSGVDRLPGSGSQLVGPIKNAEDLVNEYINSPKGGFRDILERLAAKDDNLKGLQTDLESLSGSLGRLKDERQKAYLKARGLSDLQAHGSPTISFFKDGVKNTYKVDPEIAAAVNHYNAVQMNGLFNAVKVLNNVFKYGTTQGNPAFAIPNFLRDQMSSAVLSESFWRTHNPINVVKALTTSILSAGGKKIDDPLWREFEKNIGSSNLVDVNKNLQKAVKSVGANINAQRSKLGQVENITVRNAAKKPFDKMDDFINALENATRYQNYRGTYKLYRAKGYSETKAKSAALLAARRNSVDFSAGGEFGKFLNSFTPYLNASIQGTRTLGRAIKERPATTTAKLVVSASPVIALTYWNTSDAARAKLYAETPEYVRQSNWVIITGNKRFLIPMSQDQKAVAGIMRSVMEAKFAHDPKSAMKEAGAFLSNFSPINANTIQGAATSFLPPVVKSSIELGTNQSFYTGQQIVPDYIKAQSVDPRGQKYEKTSGTSQKIANALGVSPIQVDYFNKSNFGELGGQVAVNTLDTVSGQEKGTRGLPASVGRRFQLGSNVNEVKSQFNNIYYPLQNTSAYKQRQIGSLIYNGQDEKAQRVASEWNAQVDKSFSDYYKRYGQYADPTYADRIGNLKIDVQVSKKGRPYIKR